MAKTRKQELNLVSLTPREKAFLDNVAQGLQPQAAARAAGYANPRNEAERLTRNPKILAEITRIQNEARARHDLTVDDCLQGFLDAASMAANSMELTAAWREISRIVGAYSPERVELSVDINDSSAVRKLTTAELMQLAGDLDLEDADVRDVIDGEVVDEEPSTEGEADGGQ